MSIENVNPQVLKRLAKEIAELAANLPDGIKVLINEENITDIQALIQGPASTPFEGGVFRVKLTLSEDFPAAPPKGTFLTKIFHPNVSKNGEICVNTLKKDWKSEYGIAHVLTVVKCLLIHPNAESALNEEAGKLLLERYDDFARHAKMMTDVHAREKVAAPAAAAAPEEGKEEKKVVKAAADKKRSLKRL